jgi:hypothetical protein
MHVKIIENYNKIYENLKEYIETNTGDDLIENILKGDLNMNLLKLLTKLTYNLPIFKSGGGQNITYHLNDYNINNLKNKNFNLNKYDEIDTNLKNIIIIGAGINGLYMSILLKLFIPEINIIILTKQKYSETLIRDQLIRNSIEKSYITIDKNNNDDYLYINNFIQKCMVNISLFYNNKIF